MAVREIEYKESPLKAIRAKCVECFGGNASEVKSCSGRTCPLYPYRFGKNPYREPRIISDEQRHAAAERLKKWRENKDKDTMEENE